MKQRGVERTYEDGTLPRTNAAGLTRLQTPHKGMDCPKPWGVSGTRTAPLRHDWFLLFFSASQFDRALDTPATFCYGLDCVACCRLVMGPCPSTASGQVERGDGVAHRDWKQDRTAPPSLHLIKERGRRSGSGWSHQDSGLKGVPTASQCGSGFFVYILELLFQYKWSNELSILVVFFKGIFLAAKYYSGVILVILASEGEISVEGTEPSSCYLFYACDCTDLFFCA